MSWCDQVGAVSHMVSLCHSDYIHANQWPDGCFAGLMARQIDCTIIERIQEYSIHEWLLIYDFLSI